jgi:hypothetical protein
VRACHHCVPRSPGSRSIDIRMWSPRAFRRILAFEISLSPNLNFILESSSTSLVGEWSPFGKECGNLRSARYQSLNIIQRNISKARRRSPNSERHNVNDPRQRSVGQRNLTLPYLHYTPSERYRSRLSQRCSAKPRRRRIRTSPSGS